MEIKWTYSAINDLQNFKENTKILNSQEYISKLVNEVNLLIENPKLGKILMYLKHKLVRQFIHEKHKILYYIEEDKIHIIAVLHHKQDIRHKINYIKNQL